MQKGQSERLGVLLRRADQVCAATLMAAALSAILLLWIYRGGLRGELINIEQAPAIKIQFQLDINRADWPEWTLLPGIGEMLARRIVESRTTEGPFATHDDLQRVKGIGPKTLVAIRPYLAPISGDLTAHPTRPE